MEVAVKFYLDDFHKKAIPSNSVIDMALVGSSKEPISYITSWSNLDLPDGIIQDLL